MRFQILQKKGYECIHNKIYWKVQPYIGIGISSHSNFDNKRFWNVDNLEDYFKCIKASLLPISGEEKIDKKNGNGGILYIRSETYKWGGK